MVKLPRHLGSRPGVEPGIEPPPLPAGLGAAGAPRPALLFDPAELSRLGRVEVIATRVVEGYLSGRHRSPFKGSSIEFAEHRAYTPGDEIRLIDWRAWARSDRYYIKEYEQDTNLSALLVLDASGSMAFGRSTVTKLRYAQMAAAILARLLLQQQDAAGLAVLDSEVRHYVPPRSNPGHFSALVRALEAVQPRGGTSPASDSSLAAMLHKLAHRMRRRGLIIILSDCFDDLEALRNALQHLHWRGHEVLLLQVLAPEETDFSIGDFTEFEDLERPGRRLVLDPAAVRRQYLERFQAFQGELEAMAGRIGIQWQRFETSQPLGDVLGLFLRRRTRLQRQGVGRAPAAAR